MSHLIIEVNNQDPNAQGEINTLTLEGLSDVNAGSTSTDEMITWSGSAWSPSADSINPPSALGNGGNVTSESGTLHTFPNPNLGSSDVNRMFWEFAARRISNNPYFSLQTTGDLSYRYNAYAGGGTRWVCGFTFATAGVYAMRAALHVGGLSATTAYVDCVWADASYQFLGPITRFSKVGNKRNTMRGIIDASSGDVAGLYVTDYSGARYNRASYSTIFIEVERIA